MEISLQTNSENPKLEFRDIERLGVSDLRLTLYVVSGSFSMEFSSFYVEEYSLNKFTEDILKMDRSMNGTARLKPLYEHNFVEFTMTETGQVHVEGKVEEYSALENRMTLGFTTDQTCLGPFARDLARISIR